MTGIEFDAPRHAPRMRGIQYAAASRINHGRRCLLDHPHARVTTIGVVGPPGPARDGIGSRLSNHGARRLTIAIATMQKPRARRPESLALLLAQRRPSDLARL
jgi:hypothetical protein